MAPRTDAQIVFGSEGDEAGSGEGHCDEGGETEVPPWAINPSNLRERRDAGPWGPFFFWGLADRPVVRFVGRRRRVR